MSDRCDTCSRRLRGAMGELVSTDTGGNRSAWCSTHSRHRPPWYGSAGWPWMRELDRLWLKAEESELNEMLKNGGRDLIFSGRPPLSEGEVRHIGSLEVHVLWVRQSKPGRWTVRVRRTVPERALMLRTGSLPFRSDKSGKVHAPTPTEIERAATESAYQGYEDPLDAGQAPSSDYAAKLATKARLRMAETLQEEIECG